MSRLVCALIQVRSVEMKKLACGLSGRAQTEETLSCSCVSQDRQDGPDIHQVIERSDARDHKSLSAVAPLARPASSIPVADLLP